MISKLSGTIRIHTSLERWRYSIGLLTTTTLIAQLLTAGNGQPIEPIEGMGEIKAEMRSKDDTTDELQTENKRLMKEVERFRNNEGRKGGNAKVPTRNESRTNNRNSAARNPGSYRTINVEATAYTARCSGCTGVTASGYDVRSTIYTPEGLRVIAVDTSVIALGSIVKVTLDNGDSFEAKAEDTGGDIRGNRIDILVESTDEAFSLGRQSATVDIITEGER